MPNNFEKMASDCCVDDTFTLACGVAVLHWPIGMSAEDFEDFSSWLELELHKIKRSVAASVTKG